VVLGARKPDTDAETLRDDLKKFMHGRGNRERRDSVTNEILLERQRHLRRLEYLEVDPALVSELKARGMGKRRRNHQIYSSVSDPSPFDDSPSGFQQVRKTNSGAGGFATFITSAACDWPVFKHLLPEIAFAGHSNSGKVCT
jgi:hypothetical protein